MSTTRTPTDGTATFLPLPLREGVGGRGWCRGRTAVPRAPNPSPHPGPLRGPSPQGEGAKKSNGLHPTHPAALLRDLRSARLAEIRRAAATGIYDIRGAGAKRKLPHFDDLLFLGASISRYPLEGYRERCGTDVLLGTRFAKRPIALKIPITIAGMSFGSLSAQAKEALGRGASIAGTSTTTGDGGMTNEEREHSRTLVYQVLPSRYGMNPDDLRRADAIEVVVGQGAKPGGGGMLLGQKVSERVAGMRALPRGHRPALGLPPSRLDRPGRSCRSRSRNCAKSPTGRSRST